VVFGPRRAGRFRQEQIARLIQDSLAMGNRPTLIGETGIPFNLRGQRAYERGDFKRQAQALDATMHALEANLASFTLWNYTPDNTNAHGDLWNGEDFSLFSRDQQVGNGSVHDGGRALEAAVRPYAAKVAGIPLRMAFDLRRRHFEFDFRVDPRIEAPTEIFVPEVQYPAGYVVQVTAGAYEMDPARRCLRYYADATPSLHTVRIDPR
jgi:hypothetical protein